MSCKPINLQSCRIFNWKIGLTDFILYVSVNNVGMLNAISPCYHCEAEDFEQVLMNLSADSLR